MQINIIIRTITIKTRPKEAGKTVKYKKNQGVLKRQQGFMNFKIELK